MFPGVSMSEVFVIFVVVLLVMGPKGVPKAARRIGQFMREAQRVMDELKKEFRA